MVARPVAAAAATAAVARIPTTGASSPTLLLRSYRTATLPAYLLRTRKLPSCPFSPWLLATPSRLYNTGTPAPLPPQQQPAFVPPPPPPPPPTLKKRRLRVSTVIFLLLGIGIGSAPAILVNLYERAMQREEFVRGSEAELKAMENLRRKADELDVVRRLTADPDWEEWDVGQRWSAPSTTAADVQEVAEAAAAAAEAAEVAEARAPAEGSPAEESLPQRLRLPQEGEEGQLPGGDLVEVSDVNNPQLTNPPPLPPPSKPSSVVAPPTRQSTRLTTGAMGGFRGMTGCHRIFHNTVTGEVTSVMHLGPFLSGWPLTAHGGALATILDEALGRCAILSLPARTGVTARLELQYKKPVMIPGFYMVHCKPRLPGGAANDGKELRKLWCEAVLTDMEGQLHVGAKALFVVPRKYNLGQVQDKF